jgi:hypothetical protein
MDFWIELIFVQKRILRTLTVAVKKRQHKFLIGPKGQVLQEIFEQTGCSIELPPYNSPEENIILRGPQEKLVPGLQVVLEKSNSVVIEELPFLPLHGKSESDIAQAEGAWKFIVIKERQNVKKLEGSCNVQIFFTTKDHGGVIEVQGRRENVDAALQQLRPLCQQLVCNLPFSLRLFS